MVGEGRGGLYLQYLHVGLRSCIYIGERMGLSVVYLHERYLQVRYLQYIQVCYVCQREQFQRMAFQGIEIPWGVLTLVLGGPSR